MTIRQKIKTFFPRAVTNAPLAGLTSFNIGGRASGILRISRADELVRAITRARENKIPAVIIAGGCNVVLPRKLNKLVIVYRKNKSSEKDFVVVGNKIDCLASVYLNDLIKKALGLGLAGLEALSGIPGTVGGAVYGNAGAFGQWMAEAVDRVEVLDRRGRRYWLNRAACRFGHKDSIFKKQNLTILRVRFKFKKTKTPKLIRARAGEILRIRHEKFKKIYNRCPGSFFKNVTLTEVPKKAWPQLKEAKIINGEIPSGYLLELVGARRKRVGQIAVTDWHGNLLINLGGGTAREAKGLSTKLKALVKRRFGIELTEEVQFIQ